MISVKLYCKTCKTDLVLIGSSNIDKTLVLQPDGRYELDTSEWGCACFDDDGNCLVNEDEAQDHTMYYYID